MTTPSVQSLVNQAVETARLARGSYAAGQTAGSAQAEATAALALAVRHAGDAIGMGLKSIADAIARS